MITIYCDGTAGEHSDQRETIMQFVSHDEVWTPERRIGVERLPGRVYEMLRDDSKATRADLQSETLRGRYRFECQRCGQTIAVRGEKFRPMLDVLRSADIAEISLTAIQTRLRNG